MKNYATIEEALKESDYEQRGKEYFINFAGSF